MKNKEHLPLMGVGPVYVMSIIALTVIGIVLSVVDILNIGKYDVLKIPFAILGVLLIALGVFMWFSANFASKLDDNIKSNKLVTTGIYAWVRNPIYSAFLLMCTGAILIANNIILLLLPLLYWIFMTVLMKNTEEKWLQELYGQEYTEYCQRVNRCIPWFPQKPY